MVWYELIEEVWLKLGTLAIDDIRTLYHVCKLPIETQHCRFNTFLMKCCKVQSAV